MKQAEVKMKKENRVDFLVLKMQQWCVAGFYELSSNV